MEGESVDAGGENHLENVLSQTEITNIPNPVAVKINEYIDQKFSEYLTSKALYETSKSQIGEYPVFLLRIQCFGSCCLFCNFYTNHI